MQNTETIQSLLNRVRTCQLSIHFQYKSMPSGVESFEQFKKEFDQEYNV